MKTMTNGARRLGIGVRFAGVAITGLALGGCVQIATPDKPIEINLNINIKQEIVYKLDGDAKKLIEQNSEIF
ncbi:YnbE family lipoprotein [Sphingopyxis sp. BSN-002]|uniref:YnbE family lipoprotein n=1 Tax=Sphingopyxis sp. BSN-002 TaxID=2911495 RepID=UPI001EDA21C2|nr:YnbE family lipoprotein [Sphingopyxis sp. BSN-002]UKK84871.1 YnbE family lipoprotein [Sphingopyxis sp. BSN-002]